MEDGEYGLGKDKTVAILDSLTDFSDIQVVAIAGKNEKMKIAFENVINTKNRNEDFKVLSFTDKVPELMAISDLVITKPGGLTVSESLASHLPLIVINPIPGQEEENAEFLENAGCAVWLKKTDNPSDVISSVLGDDTKLDFMRQQSVNLSKPNSTKDICKKILS